MMMTLKLAMLNAKHLEELIDAYEEGNWDVDFITFSEKYTAMMLEDLGAVQSAYARMDEEN
jgi:hypothetical protein